MSRRQNDCLPKAPILTTPLGQVKNRSKSGLGEGLRGGSGLQGRSGWNGSMLFDSSSGSLEPSLGLMRR